MFCKKCGSPLTPSGEMLVSEDAYYRGGARCRSCNYLYFPDYPPTWNTEAWISDFDRKAEVILHQAYPNTDDWRRDVYLTLQFLDCLDNMVTLYFSSPEFNEHDRLVQVLRSLGAAQSVTTLESIVQLATHPELVLERFGLVGDSSELVDDAWEEVTVELSESLDTNLRKLVYERFMRDHDISALW